MFSNADIHALYMHLENKAKSSQCFEMIWRVLQEEHWYVLICVLRAHKLQQLDQESKEKFLPGDWCLEKEN